MPFGSGVDEFDAIMKELKRRSQNSAYPRPTPAGPNKVVWERQNGHHAEVRTLSPSDAGQLAAIARFSELATDIPRLRGRLPAIKDNHASVVLSVRVSGVRILLGGDLQVRADRLHGWNAVIDDHVGDKHDSYKIPHHGSHNADHPEIWEKLLKLAPFTGTTPFVRANLRLPTIDDCNRILARTPNAYLSAPPLPSRFRNTNPRVEKKVRERTRQVQFVPGSFGHVRMRRKIEGASNWDVRLFGAALHVSAVEARVQAAKKD